MDKIFFFPCCQPPTSLFNIFLSTFSRFLRLAARSLSLPFPLSLSVFLLALSLFPSVTLKQSHGGERADCTRRHGNVALMMATSMTRRLDWRAPGRGTACEATAQLTPQICPLICFFSLHLFTLFRQPMLNRHLIDAALASCVC